MLPFSLCEIRLQEVVANPSDFATKADATGMKEIEGVISKSEACIVKLDAQEAEFTCVINREKKKFDGLRAQAADLDQDELADARLALRPQKEREAQDRIRRADSGRKINFWKFQGSISDADKLLGEGDMIDRREEWKQLRHMEERQRPKRVTGERQQER